LKKLGEIYTEIMKDIDGNKTIPTDMKESSDLWQTQAQNKLNVLKERTLND